MPNTPRFETPIRHDVLVRASPEKVYDALTIGEEMDKWFTTGAKINPVVGGQCHFAWEDWGPDKMVARDEGEVLEADRPHKFAFRWHGDWATVVRIDIEEHEEGSAVRLTETGYPDTPEGRAMCLGCAAGWGEALTLLKFHLEHGVSY